MTRVLSISTSQTQANDFCQTPVRSQANLPPFCPLSDLKKSIRIQQCFQPAAQHDAIHSSRFGHRVWCFFYAVCSCSLGPASTPIGCLRIRNDPPRKGSNRGVPKEGAMHCQGFGSDPLEGGGISAAILIPIVLTSFPAFQIPHHVKPRWRGLRVP